MSKFIKYFLILYILIQIGCISYTKVRLDISDYHRDSIPMKGRFCFVITESDSIVNSIYYFKNGEYNGLCCKYYSNGNFLSRIKLRNGKEVGNYHSYYENGFVHEFYSKFDKKGNPYGRYYKNYPNGKLNMKGRYRYIKGVLEIFNVNKNKSASLQLSDDTIHNSENKSSAKITFSTDTGSVVLGIQKRKQIEKSGKWYWYNDKGFLTERVTYANCFYEVDTTWIEVEGDTYYTYQIKNKMPVLDGYRKLYNDNGVLIRVEYWKDNKLIQEF